MKEVKREEHFCKCWAVHDESSVLLLREQNQVQKGSLLASQAVLGSRSQKQRWKSNEGGHLASSSGLIHPHSHTHSKDIQTLHTNFHHIHTHRNTKKNSMRTYPMCMYEQNKGHTYTYYIVCKILHSMLIFSVLYRFLKMK